MKVTTIILAILILVFIGQSVYFYPQLPETIASHFDSSGQANGFMAKSSFFIFEGVLLAGLLGVFLLIAGLFRKLPDSMMNLPNKDYWLAPERREQTLAVLINFFGRVSLLVVAVFIAINQLTLNSNLTKTDPNPVQLWIVLSIFFAAIVILVFAHMKRFFTAPAAQE